MEKNNLITVRGTHDILPQEQKKWQYVKETLCRVAQNYGFSEITTPLMEYGQIFSKAIGEETDIIAKEMYYLKSNDDHAIALRPEGTAGVVRAYYEHGLFTEPSPLRLFYYGPMFRHERPQKGRLRQFHQFGVESIGENAASEDALSILLGKQILDRVGLPNRSYSIVINSIGCPLCRPKYIKKLASFIRGLKKDSICEDCARRANVNPLRLFDCKNPHCQSQYTNAPTPLDFLCNECKQHFKELLEYLEETKIEFTVNDRLVRGLDYYTRTVFEFVSSIGDSRGLAIIAGGRYDNLVSLFGKRSAPAIGFGMGIERFLQIMADAKISFPKTDTPEVFVVQLGESARRKSFSLIQQLVAGNISISSAISKDGLKSQLRAADRSGAHFAIIIGQREIIDKTIILKDLKSGGQETVDIQQCTAVIKDRLSNLDCHMGDR
jgi:histidyl-tRNA synthetase